MPRRAPARELFHSTSSHDSEGTSSSILSLITFNNHTIQDVPNAQQDGPLWQALRRGKFNTLHAQLRFWCAVKLTGACIQAGVKDVVTLFHEPASASSVRVLNLLKQAQANASTTTTIDQASSTDQPKAEHNQFELDVQEQAPTSDQVQIILEYLGAGSAGKVVEGASSEEEAVKKFKLNANSFVKPLVRCCPAGPISELSDCICFVQIKYRLLTILQVVDWNAGKAVVGDNQSEILRLLEKSRSS